MSIEITMPRLSDTMESGTVIKWNVKEGDEVSAGDVIADIETDKATMEMAVYDDGRIAALLIDEGQSVDVGTPIAMLAADDEDLESVKSEIGKTGGAAREGEAVATSAARESAPAAAPRETEERQERQTRPEQETQAAAASTEAPAAARGGGRSPSAKVPGREAPSNGQQGGRLRVSPVARHLAEEHGLDLRSIQGSGPSGRIIKRDVLQAVETGQETAAAVAPGAKAAPGAPGQLQRVQRRQPSELATRTVPETSQYGVEAQIVPVSNMRQTIARRLVESKQTIPHYQVSATFNVDALMDLRQDLNRQLEAQGVKLSVNDFLVRACALAMYQHPFFNASWLGDGIEIHGQVNIGIAISMPVERGGGLVVGTLRDADRRSLREISHESKRLAEKARERGLSIEEMSDSTFTISNLGMFGVDHFTAIINPPNTAILAVGAAIQKPVVRDGELAVGYEMTATLSCDHRVIDGAMAAQFMQTLREFLENPATMMV